MRSGHIEWAEMRQLNFVVHGPKCTNFFHQMWEGLTLFSACRYLNPFQSLKLSGITRTVDFGWLK